MDSNEGNNGAGYTVKEIVVRLEAKIDKVMDDHEKRLRLLESDGNQRKGAGAFLMSSLAFIAAVVAVVSVFLH